MHGLLWFYFLLVLVRTQNIEETCGTVELAEEAMKLAYCQYTPSGDTERNLPPVILLHGMMDSKITWHIYGSKIANLTGRKVYALDARNHGDSGWSDDFNFDILADDLEEFMDDFEINKAVLIGHSMGGKTAMTIALRTPERVEKLVVEDMTTRNITTKAGNMVAFVLRALREFLSAIPQGSDEVAAAKFLAQHMSDLIPLDQLPVPRDEEFNMQLLPVRRLENGTYAWKTNLDVLEKALTQKDRLVQTISGVYMGDALFIYGPKSFFRVGKDADLIKKFFPRAEFVAVDGANHLIHHMYPREFLKEVVEFINGQPLVRQRIHSKY